MAPEAPRLADAVAKFVDLRTVGSALGARDAPIVMTSLPTPAAVVDIAPVEGGLLAATLNDGTVTPPYVQPSTLP